ncbi:MAG: restriction endonuclease subunit S [Parvularcula sp.]|jgi:type I restriction enzyme S subunit|nr:restriction endonuclease subunit S [Parvularcula sp.]
MDYSNTSGFNEKPLKALCRMNTKSLGEDTDPDQQIRYIDIGGVSYQEGVTSRETLTFSSAPSRARRCVKKGDIIISTVRTYLRAVAMIDDADDGAIASTGFAVCRANEDTDARFLYYAMMAEPFIEQVIVKSTGISYPAINSSTLGGIKLLAPDRQRQAAIAAFLDRETRRIDDLIAEKDSFIALLREKRVAEISHAVTKGINPDTPMKPSGAEWLGNVPTHWEAVRLGVLFKEADRKGDPGLPVLSVSIHDGVSDDEVADEDRARKVALSEDRSVYQGVLPGDLVYNMMRAWQGGFGAVATEGLVSPAYVVARPLSDARTKFIELQLRTPQAVEEMRRYSKGIADFRMRLYWEHFRNVRVAIPSPEEQDRILAAIDREITRIDGLITETERSIALLKEKRAALITAAVTGKIDVRSAA